MILKVLGAFLAAIILLSAPAYAGNFTAYNSNETIVPTDSSVTFTVRSSEDRTVYGTPVVDLPEKNLQVFMRLEDNSANASAINDDIDDLALERTCGIWVCGDECFCWEFECFTD